MILCSYTMSFSHYALCSLAIKYLVQWLQPRCSVFCEKNMFTDNEENFLFRCTMGAFNFSWIWYKRFFSIHTIFFMFELNLVDSLYARNLCYFNFYYPDLFFIFSISSFSQSGVRLVRGIVKYVKPQKLILNDGTEVPYGLLVWSTGVGPSSFVKSLELPKSPGGR